jgi:hypothetical protein
LKVGELVDQSVNLIYPDKQRVYVDGNRITAFSESRENREERPALQKQKSKHLFFGSFSLNQCCESGSAWILPSTNKKEEEKTLVSTILWLLNGILFLKTDVNVPSVNNKQKNLRKKNLYCLSI